MGQTVEIIISILFFGGLFFLDSWAWGRVGQKLGYSFWAFALTFWAIVLAIMCILVLGLLIRVGNETLELIIGVSYYGGFFLLCGWVWGKVAGKLGHSFWAHALAFWLAPITIIVLQIWGHAFIFLLVPITLFLPAISILYLGFSREKRQAPAVSVVEASSGNSSRSAGATSL